MGFCPVLSTLDDFIDKKGDRLFTLVLAEYLRTGATVWLAQQWHPGTRIALLGKPDSGTQGGFMFSVFKERGKGYCRGMVIGIPSKLLAGCGMFGVRFLIVDRKKI